MLEIILWDNPILKKVSEPVPDSAFGPELEQFGQQMIETMLAAPGLGLAGPQVGLSQRIFVMTFPDDEIRKSKTAPIVVVNPVINTDGKTLYEREGCLSFPGLHDQVARAVYTTLEFQNPLNGEWNEYDLTNWNARVAQHEFDHLNGIMFFDRMSRQMRKALLREWEKANHSL
jgi:peptide deformylase